VSNQSLQRNRPSRSGCNRLRLQAGSLSFNRSAKIAHHQIFMKNEIVLLILGHWIAANAIAIISLTLVFTRFRSSLVAVLLGIISGVYGLLLCDNQDIQATGIHPIHLFSWFPILVACCSIIVWFKTRDRRLEMPDKSADGNRD
jgi:hypothetical protein